MLFLHSGSSELTEEQFNHVQNKIAFPIKPEGGVWLSPYTPDQEQESEWVKFLDRDHTKDACLVEIKEDARIAVVRTYEDLANLYAPFSVKVNMSDMGKFDTLDEYRTLTTEPEQTYLMCIDFEAMAKEYDGIHLTKEGLADTYGGSDGHSLTPGFLNAMDVTEPRFSTWGWEVPTLLLFNLDCIKSQKSLTLEALGN